MKNHHRDHAHPSALIFVFSLVVLTGVAITGLFKTSQLTYRSSAQLAHCTQDGLRPAAYPCCSGYVLSGYCAPRPSVSPTMITVTPLPCSGIYCPAASAAQRAKCDGLKYCEVMYKKTFCPFGYDHCEKKLPEYGTWLECEIRTNWKSIEYCSDDGVMCDRREDCPEDWSCFNPGTTSSYCKNPRSL